MAAKKKSIQHPVKKSEKTLNMSVHVSLKAQEENDKNKIQKVGEVREISEIKIWFQTHQ